jgi:cytosine/adenosine deaminase-related metal-dependent hydrolase
VGKLAPGWKADLQLIDAAFPTPAAGWNLYDQLILYRNPEHVKLVMVDGRILLRDGQLKTDYDPLARQALHTQAERLWQAAR